MKEILSRFRGYPLDEFENLRNFYIAGVACSFHGITIRTGSVQAAGLLDEKNVLPMYEQGKNFADLYNIVCLFC